MYQLLKYWLIHCVENCLLRLFSEIDIKEVCLFWNESRVCDVITFYIAGFTLLIIEWSVCVFFSIIQKMLIFEIDVARCAYINKRIFFFFVSSSVHMSIRLPCILQINHSHLFGIFKNIETSYSYSVSCVQSNFSNFFLCEKLCF